MVSQTTSTATLPVEAWKQLYRFRLRRLHVGPGEMNMVDQGTGSPVLMVHGNPTWSFFYHPLIARLHQQYRCVAVDHIGCGLSDKPSVYLSLDDRIDHLTQVVESLDLRDVTLVAHDWGGAIGMGTLLRCRERFARIVLLNTAAFPPPLFPWRIRACRIPVLGRLAVQGWNVFARAAISMASERAGGLPLEIQQGLLAPYNSWSARLAIYNFVADIPTRPLQPTFKRLAAIERELGHLSAMPKLLVWGMRDWCFRPECLDRFIRYWPEAEVIRLEWAGHYVLLDEPESVCARILQFLETTATARHANNLNAHG